MQIHNFSLNIVVGVTPYSQPTEFGLIFDCRLRYIHLSTVFCEGFQKGSVPSEKGTFSAVNGPSKGHH